MSDRSEATIALDSGADSGPSVSFAFNLAKVADQGEDADPIIRDGPDLGLIGVFDGMGGAGGTVYETPDGRRTGAYLASRIARDVVEDRLIDLLEPDWNLNGPLAADDLHRSVREALAARLTELNAPPSRLRSKLLRALPTTAAVVALQRARRSQFNWVGHVFWAGDSRAYVFTAEGAEQLSTDDLRDAGDAMANLHADSVVSNAMSADTEFHVSYRRVFLAAPFFVICATDGCFGYLPTPMHFEHLVLEALAASSDAEGWSRAVQKAVGAVTGDDAAMAVLGVGADFAGLKEHFTARRATLEHEYIEPLNRLRQELQDAERAVEAARRHERDEVAASWSRYRPGYERQLRSSPDDGGQDGDRESRTGRSADSVRTSVDGPADGVEEPPDEDPASHHGFADRSGVSP